MKNMFITTLSAVLMALILVACGGVSDPPAGDATPPPIEETDPPGGTDPSEPPITTEPLAFRTGQAASFVIGQDDFTTTTEDAPEKSIGYATGTPLIVNNTLYIPSPAYQRVMGYQPAPATNGAAANFVIGKDNLDDLSVDPPFVVSASSVAAPATVFTDGTDLYIADTYTNRILRYDGLPNSAGVGADLVIGQPDMVTLASACAANRLSIPSDAVIAGGKLIVTDADNHRVLIWDSVPTEENASASLVLGQPDFTSCDAPGVTAKDTFYRPVSVWSDGERLLVTDAGNNRVLVWNEFPTDENKEPDFVLGQMDFNSAESGDLNTEMQGPWDVTSDGTQIFVADQDNHRVLIWNEFPAANGRPADVVLGQSAFGQAQVNGGSSAANDAGFDEPAGLLVHEDRLYVGDLLNKRYLVFEKQE